MNRIFEAIAKGFPGLIGKTFWVSATDGAYWNELNIQYPPNKDGVTMVHSTPTLALAQCTAAYGEYIILAPDFTTVLTAAEEDSAATKGVKIIWAKDLLGDEFQANKATAALPQSAVGSLFTVTGRIKLLNLVGEVTTAIQDQAINLTLSSVPTTGASASIAAATSIRNNAAGTQYNITGTLANAIGTTVAAGLSQAGALIIPAGTIKAQTSASNTGSIKWYVVYRPIDPGARVIPA